MKWMSGMALTMICLMLLFNAMFFLLSFRLNLFILVCRATRFHRLFEAMPRCVVMIILLGDPISRRTSSSL